VDEYLLIGADVYEPLQYNYSNYNNAWVADLVRAISHRERIVLVGYSAGGVVAANFLFSNESANLTFTIIVSAPLKAPNGFGAGSIFDVVNREKIVNRKVALIYGSEDSGGFFNTKEGGKLFAEKFGLLYFEIEGADHHNAYHGKEGKDLRIQLLKQYGVPEFPVPSAVILPAIFLSYLIIKIRRKNK
jgi:predicted alpha/beta hydrolase family esterase